MQVELSNISFRYPTRRDIVALEDVTLTLEPGKLVAVVGLSGSGKSTLVALLQRLYDPDSGQVCTSALSASGRCLMPSNALSTHLALRLLYCSQNALRLISIGFSFRSSVSALSMLSRCSLAPKRFPCRLDALKLLSIVLQCYICTMYGWLVLSVQEFFFHSSTAAKHRKLKLDMCRGKQKAP